MFAWGSADSEDTGSIARSHAADDSNPIYHLLRLVLEYPRWGAAIWCCLKRNQKPQKPVEADMKKHGEWPPELDAIGENTMDAEVQANMAVLAAQIREEKSDGSNNANHRAE